MSLAEVVRVKPVVNRVKCETCSVCVRGCPAELVSELRKEQDSLRGYVYKAMGESPWTFEKPPCQLACPIDQDIRRFSRLIVERKYVEAMEAILETNALPSVTAYVCHHPCEANCIRNLFDEPLAIRALKRFIVGYHGNKVPNPQRIRESRGKKVSIVGSGPAGLAAAYDLARDGYDVEIFEAFGEPGGMLRWAIAPFRLPREVLDRDIRYLEALGVIIRPGFEFGRDVGLSDLRQGGASAVIMATGTHSDIKLGLEGETHIDGYMHCLSFLKAYYGNKAIGLGGKVIVVGGGNAAIDAARVARRCGAREVVVIYRRSWKEMPADKAEIAEAESEGVKIHYLTIPVGIVQKGGKVDGLECMKTQLIREDETGRMHPVPVEKSEFFMSATSVITAIGQYPDFSWNHQNIPFKLSPRNTFVIDNRCLTNIQGVFAAGDCVSGPTTISEAMASGRRAASSVAQYLSREA
jgi:NADPH-dependent glutamate synthase beta subunit-like oxidoreductase